MKWFRFYVEIIDDVKMLQLTDYEYRMFTYLMAYASEVNSSSGELQLTFNSLSLRFRQRFNHFSRAIETFQNLGLITVDDNQYITITNWNKRQFKTDNAYERVKKFREVKQKRNVSSALHETAPDTDTDTDTEKDKKRRRIFTPPTLEEVTDYCLERNNLIDPQGWIDWYASKDWMIGKNKMADWKAAIRTWESRNKQDHKKEAYEV